jgi:hypothetical protein
MVWHLFFVRDATGKKRNLGFVCILLCSLTPAHMLLLHAAEKAEWVDQCCAVPSCCCKANADATGVRSGQMLYCRRQYGNCNHRRTAHVVKAKEKKKKSTDSSSNSMFHMNLPVTLLT